MAVLDLSKWGEVINDWTKPFYDLYTREKFRYFVLKGGAGS
jgi:hypothetical protein